MEDLAGCTPVPGARFHEMTMNEPSSGISRNELRRRACWLCTTEQEPRVYSLRLRAAVCRDLQHIDTLHADEYYRFRWKIWWRGMPILGFPLRFNRQAAFCTFTAVALPRSQSLQLLGNWRHRHGYSLHTTASATCQPSNRERTGHVSCVTFALTLHPAILPTSAIEVPRRLRCSLTGGTGTYLRSGTWRPRAGVKTCCP